MKFVKFLNTFFKMRWRSHPKNLGVPNGIQETHFIIVGEEV